MTHIRNRKHGANRYLSAALLAAAAVPALSSAAMAQEKADKKLEGVTVTAEENTYKADVVSSPKQTQALIDTPKTVQVIKKEVIQEQQATTLVEALRNTPGITLQMGENGNTSSGDTFQMRGFDMSSSLLVDGLRDRGVATRDTFNIEQIEVVKGAGGADTGRGASSGYINVSTKQASLDDAASASATAYTQGGYRATADVNKAIGETSALRLNVLSQDIDTAGRDHVKRSGYGVAAAYGIGLETKTRFHLSGQYLNNDNVPDGGISSIGWEGFYNATAEVRAAGKVRSENFYGSVSDFENQEQGSVTAKFEHDFAAGIYFTNVSRWSNTSLERVLTGVNGITATTVSNPATWTLARSRQRVNQKAETFNNVSNFVTSFETGALTHDLVFGFEYSDETTNTGSFTTVGTTTLANLYNPNPNDTMASLILTNTLNTSTGAFPGQLNTAWTISDTQVASIYAFDTISFGEKWIVNLGFRSDSYRLEYTNYDYLGNRLPQVGTTAPTATTPRVLSLKAAKSINAYKAGLVYKPTPNGSIYVSYATSVTPPGSAGTLSNTAININNANVDPSETKNLEAGVKWDLFEGRLGLTGAYYKTNLTNAIVADTNLDGYAENLGDREIKGFEIGLNGQITDKWNITAGIQTMDDKQKEGGTVGSTSRWSPELSGSFWSTYALSDKIKLGGGARYMGEQKRDLTVGETPATSNMAKIPEYWVVDAYGSYQLTAKAALQLNVYNLADEDYIGQLNNGGARLIPGAPRSASLTLNYRF
ncbi:TonB-dependent siderophore receptor [Asticcacaulis sp. BYS171W]|uniref:TonB-dependent siderophore receptor n=1 Tax=Asticcacaulis aquaticus TaxID=2984212 RepID=A0ABT5HX63_9CAUL|nr:TonB-dependent siderophore receptor [Asticcacaulis aquaticus]MDC7684634.1 TonB-dependent siderophore receptor [Asticcacaulis aquaticus]